MTDQLLPDYNGEQPADAMRSTITGLNNRLTIPTEHGDRAVIVVELKTSKVGHDVTDDGVIYHEARRVVDVFEVNDTPASRLLAALRSARRRTRNTNADGSEQGELVGDEGYTDASGIVLTPREVAEWTGALGLDSPTDAVDLDVRSVVVKFDDESSLLWPDEFAEGTVGPLIIGARYGEREVVEILDSVTGEPVHDANLGKIVEIEIIDDGFDDGIADYDDVPPMPDTTTTPDPDPVDDIDATIPDDAAREFVKVPIGTLVGKIGDVADLILLRRFLNAERESRRRKGAIRALEARIAAVEARSTDG